MFASQHQPLPKSFELLAGEMARNLPTLWRCDTYDDIEFLTLPPHPKGGAEIRGAFAVAHGRLLTLKFHSEQRHAVRVQNIHRSPLTVGCGDRSVAEAGARVPTPALAPARYPRREGQTGIGASLKTGRAAGVCPCGPAAFFGGCR